MESTHTLNEFSDLYERTMSNTRIMEEGRKAVEFFKSMGLIEEPRRTKTGRASYPTYGKTRTGGRRYGK
jgi:hypothetical protein